MKHLSLILNGVLFIAVGFLFYLHFGSGRDTSGSPGPLADVQASSAGEMTIVYVNIDTLLNNYDYFTDLQAEFSDRQAELEKIADLGQDAVVVAYLESPKVHFKDKAMLLRDKLGDMDPMTLNLIYLLITRNRVDMLPDIAIEYKRLVDDYNGVVRAEVTTAVPLDEGAKKDLSQKIGNIIGKKIIIEPEYVDSSLIGGVVVRVAGKLVDGSTQGKLDALKKKIGK